MNRLFVLLLQLTIVSLMATLPLYALAVILGVLALVVPAQVMMIIASFFLLTAVMTVPVLGMVGLLLLFGQGYRVMEDAGQEVDRRKRKENVFIRMPVYEHVDVSRLAYKEPEQSSSEDTTHSLQELLQKKKARRK